MWYPDGVILDPDACHAALVARDPRFDGVFFVGVRTSGVYCRPVCPAKTPRRDRCAFFRCAAEAERAGFRACLRCRPELAPGGGAPIEAVPGLAAAAAVRGDAPLGGAGERTEQGDVIRYCHVVTPIGRVLIMEEEGALAGVYFEGQRGAPAPGEDWAADDRALAPARRQLEEYFGGMRTAFDLPLAPRGTAFQRRVFGELARIPFGETITYGELAHRVGRPAAARAVGAANARNPLSIVVPCHRVIGARGELTGYAGGLERKRWLLAHERALRRAPPPRIPNGIHRLKPGQGLLGRQPARSVRICRVRCDAPCPRPGRRAAGVEDVIGPRSPGPARARRGRRQRVAGRRPCAAASRAARSRCGRTAGSLAASSIAKGSR